MIRLLKCCETHGWFTVERDVSSPSHPGGRNDDQHDPIDTIPCGEALGYQQTLVKVRDDLAGAYTATAGGHKGTRFGRMAAGSSIRAKSLSLIT